MELIKKTLMNVGEVLKNRYIPNNLTYLLKILMKISV